MTPWHRSSRQSARFNLLIGLASTRCLPTLPSRAHPWQQVQRKNYEHSWPCFLMPHCVYTWLIVKLSLNALWDFSGTEVGGVKCDLAHLETCSQQNLQKVRSWGQPFSRSSVPYEPSEWDQFQHHKTGLTWSDLQRSILLVLCQQEPGGVPQRKIQHSI